MAAACATVSEAKYQKLAGEYAKLRAQALVLKKAVLEEQAETANLRDQLRQRESALRRAEQEVDSLGFRNKQLEHRVAALQEEVAIREGRKRDKEDKKWPRTRADAAQHSHIANNSNNSRSGDVAQDAIIFQELQKKIMENAQLTSLIDDKQRDLQLHAERINALEQTLEKRGNDHSDLERRLRRDLEALQHKNSELETKLVEAVSMLGSEDALSVSGSENTPLHNTHTQQNHVSSGTVTTATHHLVSSEERIIQLEKEVAHWRAQYEVTKLTKNFSANLSLSDKNVGDNNTLLSDTNCGCSFTAGGITVKSSFTESKSCQSARDANKELATPPTREELIYNNFSKKFEDLLLAQCMAKSQLRSYEVEAEHLQICLENATHELKAKDEQVQSLNQTLQILEEDLTTTRINYEEQISVLTEQVISLSEQLAACK